MNFIKIVILSFFFSFFSFAYIAYANNIAQSAGNMTKHPSDNKSSNSSDTDVIMPNLGKHVSYLVSKTKGNLTFMLFIDYKDIVDYEKSMHDKISSLPLEKLKPMFNKQIQFSLSSISEAIKKINATYANKKINYKIYVTTLPNISNFLETHHYASKLSTKRKKWLKLNEYVVAIYNTGIKENIRAMPHVVMIDTGNQLNELVSNPQQDNQHS
jgi:hypothetical protein